MTQLAMNYEDVTPWEQLRHILESAVLHLGHKEVVYKLNAQKSTVSDALGDKNDRHWRQEWTITVLEMLRDRYTDTSNQFIKAILEAQAAVTRRFEVVALDDEPTDAEIEAAERLLARAKRRRKRAA
jgi:hypothetical protein